MLYLITRYFMAIVKISSKGQITIPKEVREALKLEPGDRVEVRVEGNIAILEPLRKPSDSMRGLGCKVKKRLGASAVEIVRELRRENKEEFNISSHRY